MNMKALRSDPERRSSADGQAPPSEFRAVLRHYRRMSALAMFLRRRALGSERRQAR